jgi:hypothetical protein
MRLFYLIFALTALVLCFALPAPAITLVPGTYQLEWQVPEAQNSGYGGSPSASPSLAPMAAGDKARFEGLIAQKPYWGKNGAVVVIVDKANASDDDYSKAYLLHWKSGEAKIDLRDTPGILLQRNGEWWQGTGKHHPCLRPVSDAMLPTVDLVMGKPGAQITKQVTAELSISMYPDDTGVERPYRADVELHGGWVGEVKTDQGDIEIRTSDDNATGIFGDFKNGGFGDSIQITRSSGSRWGSPNTDHLSLGRAVAYDGKLYSVSVSDTGDRVGIQPYTGPTGTLKSLVIDAHNKPASRYRLELSGDEGSYEFSSGAAVVPPGKYSVSIYISDPKDGDDWYCGGVRIGARRPVTIEQGKTVTRRFGGPATFRIDPDLDLVNARLGKSADIKLTIDVGGDDLNVMTSQSGIVVKVLDAKGRTIHNGRCESGCGSEDAWYTLDVPRSWKPGTYTLVASFDARPYQPPIIARKKLRVDR